MKVFFIILINLFVSLVSGQVVTFHGGIRPNNLKGSHFSANIEAYHYKKWKYALNYSFVEYYDSFAKPVIENPLLHIENKRDEIFIDFPELQRGEPIQNKERDFRPRDLNHRISFLIGYDLFDYKDVSLSLNGGPHVGFHRSILYYINFDFANIIVNEGDAIQLVQYHDFQIYRYWDVGLTLRSDLRYSVFKNLSLGVSGQFFTDLIDGALDLTIGVGITYNFNVTP